jgi:hypothetical protein
MITDGLNPFTVLLFLGAVVAGMTLIVLYVFARVTKREPVARITLRLLLGGAGLYVVLFLLASITSHSRVLAVGEEKHIREVDCHLAYAVAATLTPNSRYVALVDDAGNRYPGSTDGLKRQLIPGESYTTDIVFDVPTNARNLRLVLRNNDPETAFIIGHENSLLHGKTTFALRNAS